MTHTRMPTTVVISTMYPSRVRFASSSSVAKTWKKVSAEMKIIQEQVLISSSRTFFKRKLNLSKYFEHFLWTCPCWNAKDEGDCVESHHFWPPNLLSILAVSTLIKEAYENDLSPTQLNSSLNVSFSLSFFRSLYLSLVGHNISHEKNLLPTQLNSSLNVSFSSSFGKLTFKQKKTTIAMVRRPT